MRAYRSSCPSGQSFILTRKTSNTSRFASYPRLGKPQPFLWSACAGASAGKSGGRSGCWWPPRPRKPYRTSARAISVPRDRRDKAGDQRDLKREEDCAADPRTPSQYLPVVPREPLPNEVELARRIVEREGNHDCDRKQQISEEEERVERQEVMADEGPARREETCSAASPPRRRSYRSSCQLLRPDRARIDRPPRRGSTP